MSSQHLDKIQKIIEGITKVSPNNLSENTLISDLSMDSLDLFTLIGDLEDLTGVSMEDELLDGLNTIGDIISYFFKNDPC